MTEQFFEWDDIEDTPKTEALIDGKNFLVQGGEVFSDLERTGFVFKRLNGIAITFEKEFTALIEDKETHIVIILKDGEPVYSFCGPLFRREKKELIFGSYVVSPKRLVL